MLDRGKRCRTSHAKTPDTKTPNLASGSPELHAKCWFVPLSECQPLLPMSGQCWGRCLCKASSPQELSKSHCSFQFHMHPVVMSQYALRSEHRSTHSSSAGDRRALRPPRSTAPRPIRGHGSGTQRTETREIPSQHPVPRHVSRTITTQKPYRIGGWPGFWLALSLHPLLLRAVEEPCSLAPLPPRPRSHAFEVGYPRGPKRLQTHSLSLSLSHSHSLTLWAPLGSPAEQCHPRSGRSRANCGPAQVAALQSSCRQVVAV